MCRGNIIRLVLEKACEAGSNVLSSIIFITSLCVIDYYYLSLIGEETKAEDDLMTVQRQRCLNLNMGLIAPGQALNVQPAR
jgi:hypothetical protein